MLVFQPNPVVTKLFSYINAGHVSENSLSPGSKECSENNTNTIKSYTYSVSEYIKKLVHKKNKSHAMSKAEGHI